jgi:4-aminobutyrate aminotransferase/(S)-3-amino-2-methylpropionate transaminase
MTAQKGAYFLSGLRELKRRYRVIGDVDGIGMALRIEICEPSDSFTPAKAIVDRIVEEALKGDLEVAGKTYGLVLDIGGYYKNVITLAPALTISFDEIDLALQLLDRLLQRVAPN